tara:strand:- start:139 stop:666 length:528 start_codon:yes stop_codon:yes gene_type:complete
MIKISKYEFTDEASALSKIAALPHSTDEDGNNYATHSHTVVKLGYITIESGQYDADGNETKAPVLYDKYCIDVLWKDLEETDEDGNNYATHSHTVVKLGYITIESGQYDADGNETKAPVLYDKYCIDVLWKDLEETDEDGNVSIDHPYGWKSYAIDLNNEGVHSFFGVEYLDNKM